MPFPKNTPDTLIADRLPTPETVSENPDSAFLAAYKCAMEAIRTRHDLRIPDEIGPLERAGAELTGSLMEFFMFSARQGVLDAYVRKTNSKVRSVLVEGGLEAVLACALPYFLELASTSPWSLSDAVTLSLLVRCVWVLFGWLGLMRANKAVTNYCGSSAREFARRALDLRARLLLWYGIDITDFLVEGSRGVPMLEDAFGRQWEARETTPKNRT